MMPRWYFWLLLCLIAATDRPSTLCAAVSTWDGKHPIDNLEVTVVYFVPSDRQALPDWRERAQYFCRRIELFHAREFHGQSNLKTILHDEPFRSARATADLRQGDGDAIFFRTLREVEQRLAPRPTQKEAFPVLLVLSDINWRPLDDFYRLAPKDDAWVFEGIDTGTEHFPGARSGGARAAYLADRGVGWGLVSADGWRVPYRGSDCVIYHEGCGHTVGLPHPEPGNGSVMSLGQYQGWLSESWLDREQKLRLGWTPPAEPPAANSELELFTRFRALPQPRVPRPGEAVQLELDWPADAKVRTLRVRFQTSLDSPWFEVPQHWEGNAPPTARLGAFERETPVSYRVDAVLQDGAAVELWGYFQVRQDPAKALQPLRLSQDLFSAPRPSEAAWEPPAAPADEIDLLSLIDPASAWQVGEWAKEDGKLLSPKQYGARLQIPYTPPEEYRLAVVVEPLDEPNGLILGQRSGGSRFLTLVNFTPGETGLSAIENLDGQNVGNATTYAGRLLKLGRLSLVLVTVTADRVTLSVDGRRIVDWKGEAGRLSLSDYWKTPHEAAIFLGAYDCRYRFHRITLEPIRGMGKVLGENAD